LKVELPQPSKFCMDHYPLKPENMRAPANLSRNEIQMSLEELNSKIKILKGRANATTADSKHTYHEHIAGLEKKRALIAAKLEETDEKNQDWWDDISKGVDNLRNEIKKLFE
jgi:predicted mannosyl-3-phosphoglycerate phosphatase (HAD superfamily)